MIYLDGRPQKPPDFDDKVRDARKKIQDIINAGGRPASKQFESVWTEFKPIFSRKQYDGKCAYCETRFRAAYPGDIEHFKPKAEVVTYDSRGNRNEDEPPDRTISSRTIGYWDQAYNWDNWLLSCYLCNKWKGSQFPLINGTNNPLLLDPFTEEPAGHLEFDETGGISEVTDRGQAMIDVCGLDRKYLNQERLRRAAEVLKVIDAMATASAREKRKAFIKSVARLVEQCRPDENYAALARSIAFKKTGKSFTEWEAWLAAAK